MRSWAKSAEGAKRTRDAPKDRATQLKSVAHYGTNDKRALLIEPNRGRDDIETLLKARGEERNRGENDMAAARE